MASLSDPGIRSAAVEIGDTFGKCRGFYVGLGSGLVLLRYEDNSEVPCYLTPGYHPRQITGIFPYVEEGSDSGSDSGSSEEGPQHIEVLY